MRDDPSHGEDDAKQQITRRTVSVFDASMNRKRGEDASVTEAHAMISDDVADKIPRVVGLDVRGGRHVISGSEISVVSIFSPRIASAAPRG